MTKDILAEFKEFSYLAEIVSKIFSDDPPATPTIPLFSFEGLPGAGKTTQIRCVAESGVLGNCHFIDIPTEFPTGKFLRHLYSDQKRWQEITSCMPWLNVLLVSMDLKGAIDNAKAMGADMALMSRGILSTYYYNLPPFLQMHGDEDAWNRISYFMKGFIYPDAIIFLDITPETANSRVIRRNRQPLRAMDKLESMQTDRIRLIRYLQHIRPQPNIYFVNAEQSEESVTKDICSIIKRHLNE